MKRPTSAQQALWSAKLRASGFEDLESRSGTLSNRGMVTAGDDEDTVRMSPQDRLDAEAKRDDEVEALRSFRFVTAQDKEVWRLYLDTVPFRSFSKSKTAPGEIRGLRDVGERLGMPYRHVRQSIARTKAAMKERAGRDVNPVNPVKASGRDKVDRLARALDLDLLVTLVGRLAT